VVCGGLLDDVGLAAFAVCVGIAILRYRLRQTLEPAHLSVSVRTGQ
jgi:hypothetical protein